MKNSNIKKDILPFNSFDEFLTSLNHRRCVSKNHEESISHLFGKRLDEIRPTPGVRHVRDAGLFLQNQLRIASDTSAKFRWQTQRFIESCSSDLIIDKEK